MTYEKDIPEFAMQPARLPQQIPAEAVYHTEKIIYPGRQFATMYEFEEDILVPDTKADMGEILLMDAVCDMEPIEKKILPRVDDLLNLTGVITLQTLYNPEEEKGCPVDIVSKVPYKYQWNLNSVEQGQGFFQCKVKKIQHSIINERKFRVKITLEFTGFVFCEKEFSFFDGLQEDSLEMQKTEVSFSCLSTIKKQELQIDETFSVKDDLDVKKILWQNCEVIENYRQVTTEKIVVNGEVLLHLLCLTEGESGEGVCSCQHKAEFTQFIPLEKEWRKKKWQATDVAFHQGRFEASLERDGESGEKSFRLKGSLQMRVCLYEARTREMVVDAYHQTKEFRCTFQQKSLQDHCGSSMVEFSVREIVSLSDRCPVTESMYSQCTWRELSYQTEKGRIEFSGSLDVSCLWKDGEETFHGKTFTLPFRHVLDKEDIEPDTILTMDPVVKSSELNVMNESQGELSLGLQIFFQWQKEKALVLLENPIFQEGVGEKPYQMVLVVKKECDSLWDLAKRHRTTVEEVKKINGIEEEPPAGEKILILK